MISSIISAGKTPCFSKIVRCFASSSAESQQEAEALIAESLLKHPNVEEYYNLQSREGAYSALYVGDDTDKDVWRPWT